jgi:hypothetical protein
MLGDDGGEALAQIRERGPPRVGNFSPRAPVVRPAVVGTSVRHRRLDVGADRQEVVGQVFSLDAGVDRPNAAADVHTDRGRDDRADCWDDRTNRRTHAPVDVRHDRDVLVDERQRG